MHISPRAATFLSVGEEAGRHSEQGECEVEEVYLSAQICPGRSSGHNPDLNHTPSVAFLKALSLCRCQTQRRWELVEQ